MCLLREPNLTRRVHLIHAGEHLPRASCVQTGTELLHRLVNTSLVPTECRRREGVWEWGGRRRDRVLGARWGVGRGWGRGWVPWGRGGGHWEMGKDAGGGWGDWGGVGQRGRGRAGRVGGGWEDCGEGLGSGGEEGRAFGGRSSGRAVGLGAEPPPHMRTRHEPRVATLPPRPRGSACAAAPQPAYSSHPAGRHCPCP